MLPSSDRDGRTTENNWNNYLRPRIADPSALEKQVRKPTLLP
ncbi:MAG: hypothetical protein ACOC1Z_01235 [Cyanobacteriota bacterium]